MDAGLEALTSPTRAGLVEINTAFEETRPRRLPLRLMAALPRLGRRWGVAALTVLGAASLLLGNNLHWTVLEGGAYPEANAVLEGGAYPEAKALLQRAAVPLADQFDVEKNSTTIESKVRQYSSWSTCQKRKAGFLPAGDRLTMLASFPGSGNTWTRCLLECSTGVYTGDWEDYDRVLWGAGYKGEGHKDSSVVAIKTHRHLGNLPETDKLRAVILLVRNPYRAILSEYNRLKSNSHTGHAAESHFTATSSDWKKQVEMLTKRWRDFHLYWLYVGAKRPTLVHVVLYERLRCCLDVELRRLLTFIAASNPRVPYPSEDAIQAVLQNPECSFHRKSGRLQVDPFTQGMNATIDAAIGYVADRFRV